MGSKLGLQSCQVWCKSAVQLIAGLPYFTYMYVAYNYLNEGGLLILAPCCRFFWIVFSKSLLMSQCKKIKLLYFSRAPRLRKFGYFMHPRNLCSDRIFCRYEHLPLHVSRCKKSTTLNPMHTNWLNWYRTAMSWPLDSCQNRASADQCHMTISQAQVYNSSKWCVLYRVLHLLVYGIKVIAG